MVVQNEGADLHELESLILGEGYEIVAAEDEGSALRQFFNSHPEIVVVDLAIGDQAGWTLVRRIREISSTPIIALAEDASAGYLTRGAELGVDGFVVRPFEPTELLLRLNAVRDELTAQGSTQKWLYQEGRLTIDWRSCDVYVDGEAVALTSTEYRLLAYLVQNRGWVLTHDQILNNVWGSDYGPDRSQVKLYVWYLRQKLEDDPQHPEIIKTKRGLGYTFVG